MKKETGSIYLLYVVGMVIMLVAGCDTLAGGRPEKVYGTVISIEVVKREIVMKDAASGKERTIIAQSADQVVLLKPGMEIKAKVKRGTNRAEKVTQRIRREARKAGGEKSREE